MKKSTNHRVPGKSTSSAKDVDRYIAAVPEPARGTLKKLRAVIRSVVPAEATEAIGYAIPMFKYKGALVAYAAFSKHCSFFPMNSSLIRKFKTELERYPTSKGTIRFPLDKPLPPVVVKKLVKARIAQNQLKKKR